MFRASRSPRFDVLKSTPPVVDFSRASPLDPFEQPANRLSTANSSCFKKNKDTVLPRGAPRIERAQQRKAAPRSNGLGNKLPLLLLYRLPLMFAGLLKPKGQCSRLERITPRALFVKNSPLPQSALSLTQLVPFDNQKPSVSPYRCETVRRPGAQHKANGCNDISAGS